MNEPNNNQNNQNNGNGLPSEATFVVPGQAPQPENMTLGAVVNNQQSAPAPAQAPAQAPQAPATPQMPPQQGLGAMFNQPMQAAPAQAPAVPQTAPQQQGLGTMLNQAPAPQPVPTPVPVADNKVTLPGAANPQTSSNNQTLNNVVNNPAPANAAQTPVPPQPEAAVDASVDGNEKKKMAFFDSSKKSNIIALALIVLILLGGGFYALKLFVLDSPKKALVSAYDKFLESTDVSSMIGSDTFYNYDFSVNISGNESLNEISEVIGKLKLNFTLGIDDTSRTVMNGLINYDDSELINYSLLVDGKKAYLKLNNLYDRVIAFPLEDDSFSSYDYDYSNYDKVKAGLFRALKEVLGDADYSKTTTSLNGSKVRMYSLNIDSAFVNKLYSILSGSTEFTEAYGKINNKEASVALNELNSYLTQLGNKGYVIKTYVGLFNGQLKTISISNDENELVINPSGDTYGFEYNKDGDTVYSGSLVLSKMGDDSNMSFTLNSSSDGSMVTINLAKSRMDSIEALATDDTVDYDELTTTELNEISSKLEDNEGFEKLSEAIGGLINNLLSSTSSATNNKALVNSSASVAVAVDDEQLSE